MDTVKTPKFFWYRYLHPKFWSTWLMLGVMRVIAYLPWALQQSLGAALGYLMYVVLRERRRIVAINLALCFPELSETERQRMVKQNFISLGKGAIEVGFFWWASDKRLINRVHIQGIEHLQETMAVANVLLLSVHFTAIESGGQALLASGYTMQGMYKPAKNKLFDHYAKVQRSRNGKGELVPNDRIKEFCHKLSCGTLSWYAPDQIHRKAYLYAPFFGVNTSSLNATAELCTRAQARVVPLLGIRRKGGYDVHLLPPIKDFPTGDEYTDTCRINAVMEEMIRYAPEQYLWLHKRFKRLADGQPNPYQKV